MINTKLDYLQLVHEEHGVEAVTIANPSLSNRLKTATYLEICASVLGDIDCVQRAILYAKAGATVITPDVNINRDLELLSEIKAATM